MANWEPGGFYSCSISWHKCEKLWDVGESFADHIFLKAINFFCLYLPLQSKLFPHVLVFTACTSHSSHTVLRLMEYLVSVISNLQATSALKMQTIIFWIENKMLSADIMQRGPRILITCSASSIYYPPFSVELWAVERKPHSFGINLDIYPYSTGLCTLVLEMLVISFSVVFAIDLIVFCY